MANYHSRVTFDDTADVVIKGRIGGREVEYAGKISKMDVETDDHLAGFDFSRRDWLRPIVEITSYSFTFECVDGKAITAKISGKPVTHTARTHYQFIIDNRVEVKKSRTEVGAPDTANYSIDFENKEITFEWTEEVQ